MPPLLSRVFLISAVVGPILLYVGRCHAAGEMFPAFPGAEGAGAYTIGGRFGKVIAVTTLADFQPGKEPPIKGSLREAVMTRGPRIIIFRVAGNIALKHDLAIKEPYVTIAGQSAPGGGICLTNYSLEIETHDVVLRHLRIRPGDVEKKECDAISCNAQNVIIDHCSTSWSIDEVLSTNGGSANVTVQNCFITESLNRSYHHKGSHGYGSLISGPGEITYHHNLYAYHRSRNPRPGNVLLDFRNNLIYGWGDRAGYCSNENLRMNYVANDLQPLRYSKSAKYAFLPGGLNPKFYIADNFLLQLDQPLGDDWSLIRPPNGVTSEQAQQELRVDHAFPTAEVSTESTKQARQRILSDGGATLPVRDAVDARIVRQIQDASGTIINSQDDVGGWPVLDPGIAPADSDHDGMPDDWETKYQLDPQTAAGSMDDHDQDGFTDIEEFLNGTNPLVEDFWIFPPSVAAAGGDAFIGSNQVSLSTRTGGADIRYTLNDGLPDISSPLYSTPVELDRSVTLRAAAFLEGKRSHVHNARFERLEVQEPVSSVSTVPGIQFDYYEKEKWDDFPAFSTLRVTASGEQPLINLVPRKREGAFGLRFSGLFEAPREGVYRFHLRCSPHGQILIHDRLLVESEGKRCEHVGAVALKPGLHPIVFQIYFQTDDNKTLEITYEGPEIRLQPLPASALFHRNQN